MEIELIFFRVQNQLFGIEVKSINRVLTSSINKKTKKIHLEEAEIPIIDMGAYLNLNNHKTNGKKEIIVVELDGVKKGLLVDEILMVLNLNLDRVKLLPPFIKNTAKKDYFWAVAKLEDELVLLLDIRKLYGFGNW
ncbi:MAG: chemotaxis protein CheW [bacterium]